MAMALILVADDERDLVWAMQYSLADDGHDVVVAYDGSEALRLAQQRRPDLVILDIVMPEMDGLSVCRAIRRDPRFGSVPVLFLTARATIEERVLGLTEGGDDYLTNPFDLRELSARVQALLRRAHTLREPGAGYGERLTVRDLSLDLVSGSATVGGRRVHLTPAEFDLLRYLMAHPGQVHSPRGLLEQVWGYPPGTGDGSLVRWHVKNLRAKLEDDPRRPTYLRTVPRRGYILDACPPRVTSEPSPGMPTES